MIKIKNNYLALLAVSLSPLAANAGPIALDIEFEGAETFDVRNLTIGWAFSVTEEMTVDALGAWDQNADGLNNAQSVSIWTAVGTLLGSVSVDNTATAVASIFPGNTSGQWLQQDVADFVLGVGDYVIGASRPGRPGDAFQAEDTVIQTDSRLAYTGGRFIDTFGFPTIDLGGNPGAAWVFGPTFWIADDNTVVVPEPGTLALFGLGFVAFGFAKRRKNR